MFAGRKTAPALLALAALSTAACERRGPAATPLVSTVYNKDNGKLEQLLSDRDGDGRAETRAFMDGAVLKRIEIDRNGDGVVDRWETYASGRVAGPGATVEPPVIEHAEEANGSGKEITRRQFYAGGVVQRVEEDTNDDRRVDKWEYYEAGRLVRVDLDLVGKGFASQRLIYGAGGAVVRVETDPEGDGTFVAVPVKTPGI
ncbi:MAG TPA: hypothetical protein VN700_08630 [Vicinamibacterales bacterium]|nr:hypothetical protein [Vicinamibacterales bacterium]